MSKMIIPCEQCSVLFERDRKWVNLNARRGSKNFCSEACRAAHRRATAGNAKNANYCAAGCGRLVRRKPSQLKNRNNVFCSRSCANIVRKGSSHPNFRTGQSTYRHRALEYYGAACTVCGYAVEAALEVHHRDGDRKNNAVENLDVLCPTHHTEYELGIRQYEATVQRRLR